MGIKDWKKISINKHKNDESYLILTTNMWENNYKAEILKINRDKRSIGNQFIIVIDKGFARYTLDNFKTKSQALKFAKQYMRTH